MAGSHAAKDFVVHAVDLDRLEISDMRDIFNASVKMRISEEEDEDHDVDDFSDDVHKFLQEIDDKVADP